jgi:hypothetical protein
MILLFPTLLKFKSKEEKDRFMPTYVVLSLIDSLFLEWEIC